MAINPPPPGIDLAYDNGITKLQDQLKRVDQVNARAGGVVVASVAISGFFLAGIPKSSAVTWTVIGLLVVTTLIVGRALWPVGWEDAPEPRVFATLANRNPAQMKQEALATVLAAYTANERPLLVKGRWANVGAAAEAVTLAVLVIGRAIWG
jgi:hypothetical protein